ncbi:MAG: RNA-binding protein [Chloroflexi bacterium]|nr:RNA-binding protein [Chloroflexota bacterium]
MNIYVGNLAEEVTGEDLTVVFGSFGHVTSASVVRNRHSNRSRGFAFVEMPNESEARAAIAGVKGKDLKGRTMDVAEAPPREQRGEQRSRQVGGPAGHRNRSSR